MKAVFDSNSNELKAALNGLIDDICAGEAAIAFAPAEARRNIESGEKLGTMLGKLSRFYSDAQQALQTVRVEEGAHNRYLSADGTYSVPETGAAVNGLPMGGENGQVLAKNGAEDFAAEWRQVTPESIGAQRRAKTLSLALLPQSWEKQGETFVQRIAAPGLGEPCAAVFCPAPESHAAWCENGVRALAADASGVTFAADSAPQAALAANVLLLEVPV